MARRRVKGQARFPADYLDGTRCGARLDDYTFYRWVSADGSTFGRSYPHHAPRSESRSQRTLLASEARILGYQPPGQTCCANQASVLISYLRYLIQVPRPAPVGSPASQSVDPQRSISKR